jgi:hypothetical protein
MRGSPSWPGPSPQAGYVDADAQIDSLKSLADGAGHTLVLGATAQALQAMNRATDDGSGRERVWYGYSSGANSFSRLGRPAPGRMRSRPLMTSCVPSVSVDSALKGHPTVSAYTAQSRLAIAAALRCCPMSDARPSCAGRVQGETA